MPTQMETAEEHTKRITLVAVTIAMTAIGMLVVGFRCFTRAFLVRAIGWDDWTILMATILSISNMAITLADVKLGIGIRVTRLSEEEKVAIVKMSVAIKEIFFMNTTFVKISVLFFYLRIGIQNYFEKLVKSTVYLLVCFECICFIVVATECVPLRKEWDSTIPGQCIDRRIYYYFAFGLHLLIELWIFVLPLKLVFSIQRPLREKIGLWIVFGIGILSIVATVIRIQYQRVPKSSSDQSQSQATNSLWVTIEINTAIICASLPTLRPLFSSAQRNRTRAAAGVKGYAKHTSGSHSNARGNGRILRGTHISITETLIGGNKSRARSEEDEWELNDVATAHGAKGREEFTPSKASAVSNGSEEHIVEALQQ